MKFETIADLYFVIAIFVPGFIYDAVLSKFVPRHASTLREFVLLRLFTATAFNYAVCSPLIYLLVTGALFVNKPCRSHLQGSQASQRPRGRSRRARNRRRCR
jgi:hypothetical protein